MVRLRLQRHGAKKRPFYRVVAADKRAPRDGRFIEMLGTYDPLQEPPIIRLNRDRVEYWIGVGAQPSETVNSLIIKMRDGQAIDLSEEGADEAARQAKAEAKKVARAERRKQVAEAKTPEPEPTPAPVRGQAPSGEGEAAAAATEGGEETT